MIVLLIAAAGCGGANEEPRGASPASPAPSSPDVTPTTELSCPPPTVSLAITAKHDKFNKECLAVPAHEPFTIRFRNADEGVSHNFAIHSMSLIDTFLVGKIFEGVKTITLNASALEPGEYRFHCDVHPVVMNGTLVVSG
jgi:plastocyanin